MVSMVLDKETVWRGNSFNSNFFDWWLDNVLDILSCNRKPVCV